MKVLVVEDEVNLGTSLCDGLEAEGIEAELVGDGITGVERGSDTSFDAIVLDIMLPGLNGFRVCADLRTAGVTTPILMLTAKDGELDEAEALDTGADDFLRKPFSFVVLVARLNALARRGARGYSGMLEVGDLVLDRESHRARRGDVLIDLTPREFALLAILLAQPGKAIRKVDLVNEVWGADFEGDPNIVEVYIGYLRRKIDLPFSRRSIETVRGIGYRMDPSGG